MNWGEEYRNICYIIPVKYLEVWRAWEAGNSCILYLCVCVCVCVYRYTYTSLNTQLCERWSKHTLCMCSLHKETGLWGQQTRQSLLGSSAWGIQWQTPSESEASLKLTSACRKQDRKVGNQSSCYLIPHWDHPEVRHSPNDPLQGRMQSLPTHKTKGSVSTLPQDTQNVTACKVSPASHRKARKWSNKYAWNICTVFTPHQTNQSLAAIRQKSARLNHWHFLHWLQRNWSLKRRERAADTAANRGLSPAACCTICSLSSPQTHDHFISASGPLLGWPTAQWPTLNLDSLLPSLTAKILSLPDSSPRNSAESLVKTIPPKLPSIEVRYLLKESESEVA